MTQIASQGATVAVHYTGTLDTGEVFDSSRGREPLEFQIGAGQVIAGFDRAVEGLAVGETREVRLEPAEAYGHPKEELVVDVPADQFAGGGEPQVGEHVQVQVAEGQNRVARIADVKDDTIRLDLNHPLAGKALTFDVELVEVR